MDETVKAALVVTTVVVLAIGIAFMSTHRKLDVQHGETHEKLDDLAKGQQTIHDRLDREGKEALHGITQLRVRFAELWNDRKEAFMQWWERQ